jgi:hypothetical protein
VRENQILRPETKITTMGSAPGRCGKRVVTPSTLDRAGGTHSGSFNPRASIDTNEQLQRKGLDGPGSDVLGPLHVPHSIFDRSGAIIVSTSTAITSSGRTRSLAARRSLPGHVLGHDTPGGELDSLDAILGSNIHCSFLRYAY